MGAPGGAGVAGRAAGGTLTVDELAERTGITVRTLRFYASEGLLPAPERRGRVAYYGETHRLRLELIRTLQEHGYTLSAVQRVLARIPDDAAPVEYAVQSAVLAPWLADQTELLDRAGLMRRLGHPIEDVEIDFLESVGALERSDDDCFRVSPSMLGHAAELLRLDVPRAVLEGSARIIAEHAHAVAEGLTEVFASAVWGPYQRGELDHEQVMAILTRLRPMALQGLLGAFARAADQAAHRRLES
jgi:DNA-binding transcriptional MerR regulator